MKHHHRLDRITLGLALAWLAVSLLGCKGGGDDNPPAAVSPNGYYEGSATVKTDDDTTDLPIADLQGMLNGNRLMLMSATEQLLYDGTLTITGNNYTGELKVYKSGLPVTKDYGTGPEPMKIPVSGNVTGGSSITGTLAAERG